MTLLTDLGQIGLTARSCPAMVSGGSSRYPLPRATRTLGVLSFSIGKFGLDGGSTMKLVSRLLSSKGSQVWSLAPDASVYEAIELMSQKEVGALLVMEGERLVGIVSERDYTRKVILKGKASRETTVREIMTYPVVCARPELTIEATMALMTEKHVRHLPVVAEEKVVGVISIGDVVRSIIEEEKFEIQQLTNYITGR